MASHNHNNKVSILIVDDHEVVRNGIRSYLEALTEFNVVGRQLQERKQLNWSLSIFQTLFYSI